MKRKRIITTTLILALVAGVAFPQEKGGELVLSLKDAQDMAVKNNISVISARLDQRAAQLSVYEATAAGLPQVNLTGSFTDNLKLMTTLLPGDFFGKPGEKVPVTFGSQYNTSSSIQASMLLFNASYYLGIETAKLAKKLSDQNLEKSELDTKEAVNSNYYLILVSEKSLEIMNGNIANLNETLKSTRAMFSAGMAEATDVDQMISNIKMLENGKSSLERSIELSYNMLRLQLGVDADVKLKLTETLDALLLKVDVQALLSQEFDITNNINYRMIDNAENLNSVMLKSKKAAVLPSLAGFYNYGVNGMGDKIGDQRWFRNSMAGLQLSFPIFASGQRYVGIKKAQINLERAKYGKDLVVNQLSLQEKQLRYNLVNANLNYKAQKENVEVAKRVSQSMENKFRQGVASSLELTQSNSLYLQAENNYINALLNLLQSKLALDKLLNNL